MTRYSFLSSSTLPPKFAAACATALSLATISLLAGTPDLSHTAKTPSYENIVVLPTIVVVPDAADRAAAAALQTAGVPAAKRLDEV